MIKALKRALSFLLGNRHSKNRDYYYFANYDKWIKVELKDGQLVKKNGEEKSNNKIFRRFY